MNRSSMTLKWRDLEGNICASVIYHDDFTVASFVCFFFHNSYNITIKIILHFSRTN